MGPLMPVGPASSTAESSQASPATLAYLLVNVVYTILISVLLAVVFFNQNNVAVRMRGIKITAVAVASLHIYLFLLLVVPLLHNGYPCGAEFWIMSTVFPLGIAAFQVTNIRMFVYAKHQASLKDPNAFAQPRRFQFIWDRMGIRIWFRDLDIIPRIYAGIGLTGCLLLITTVILYAGSRRFDPTYGVFGQYVNPTECRKGFEWIPSVICQFLASWVIGPILIYLTRDVHDLQGWAKQLRITVAASLPGTPLWLFFLYGPESITSIVNAHFKPAMWFAPGIVAMEMTLLLSIVYGVHKNVTVPPNSVHVDWKRVDNGSRSSTSSGQTRSLANNRKAFNFQFRRNFGKILDFATTKDFTAENIQFLRDVRYWKATWAPRLGNTHRLDNISDSDKLLMWQEAALVYFELVDPVTSSCNINIDQSVVSAMAECFDSLKYFAPFKDPNGFNPACPWEETSRTRDPRGAEINVHAVKAKLDRVNPMWNRLYHREPNTLVPFPTAAASNQERCVRDLNAMGVAPPCALPPPPPRAGFEGHEPVSDEAGVDIPTSGTIAPRPSFASERDLLKSRRGFVVPKQTALFKYTLTDEASAIPIDFDLRIFDHAEELVEYLVFMNTWKNFVRALSDQELQIMGIEFDGYATTIETDTGAIFHVGCARGVLDSESEPASQPDARCAHCRRREAMRKSSTSSSTSTKK